MPRPLFIFVFVGIAAFVLLLYFKLSSGDDSTNFQTVEPNDPVLKRLRLKNPRLEIVKLLKDDFNRIPVYWVKEPGSGPTVLMPRSLAEGEGDTTIEFTTCDLAQIPDRLRYPGGTEPVCVQITNEDAKLSAFYFAAKGRMDEMVNHYDGLPTNGARRLGNWKEESRREGALPNGSRGFLYSYYFYQNVTPDREWQMLALVGYKREHPAAGGGAERVD